jgi:hypothetical protein
MIALEHVESDSSNAAQKRPRQRRLRKPEIAADHSAKSSEIKR